MVYESPFTEPIEINTPKEARDAIFQMCTWYCKKDAISQYHCSGRDAAICNELKEKIANDFKGKKATNKEG